MQYELLCCSAGPVIFCSGLLAVLCRLLLCCDQVSSAVGSAVICSVADVCRLAGVGPMMMTRR